MLRIWWNYYDCMFDFAFGRRKNVGIVEVDLGSVCSKILKSRVVVVVVEDDEVDI